MRAAAKALSLHLEMPDEWGDDIMDGRSSKQLQLPQHQHQLQGSLVVVNTPLPTPFFRCKLKRAA